MQPADLVPAQLVGLRRPNGGLHDAIQNVPVELRRPSLALGSHVVGYEPVRQFGHRGGAAFGGLLVRRVVPMCHRAQDDFRACSSAFWRDLADRSNGVTPYGGAASCASPVNDHVRLRARRAHAHAEAAYGVIPLREFAAFWCKGVHRALGDPLDCHSSLAAFWFRGNTGATRKRNPPEFPDSSVGAEKPVRIGFLSLRECLGISRNWTK